MKYKDLWPLIQADILGVLLADELIGSRPGVAVEPGDIQSVIDGKLAKVIGQGNDGKAGVGFLVLPIERAEDEDISAPLSPLKLAITIQFVEHVTINRGAAGTGIPIRVFAARAAKVLKLYTPVGLTQNLVAQKPVISEFTADDNKALRVGLVEFAAREADDIPLVRLNRPQLTVTGDDFPFTVTITAPDAEKIYFTTNGSHPWDGNAQALLYQDPVTVDESCLFRARAFAPRRLGSDTAAHFFQPKTKN